MQGLWIKSDIKDIYYVTKDLNVFKSIFFFFLLFVHQGVLKKKSQLPQNIKQHTYF